MRLFTKFYDIATAEPATQVAEQPSIASLMATRGVMNQTANMVATPIDITERKEEPKTATESTPAETATSTSTTATATPETPTQTKEPEIAIPPQIAAEATKVSSWQEVLKSQQPDTVFKEMGFDDKMVKLVSELKSFDPKVVGLIQAYKGGKTNEYLRELSTDYSKMTDEDVMRHQLRRDYPEASSRALEALFKKEVTQLYSLDSEDEAEREEGKLLLEAKAARYRASMMANQQNYLLPKPPEEKQPEIDQEVLNQQKKFEDYKSQFNTNQYTKDIYANRKISVGDGEEKFNYPVDPDALTKVLFNGERWMEKMSQVALNPDGSKTFTPDAKRQLLVAAVAEYGEDFFKEYAKHLKSLGGKTVVDSIENAKPKENSTTSQSPKGFETVAEAMAKAGRVNYGG